MDTTNNDVYKEAQKIIPNPCPILLLNRDLEKTNSTPGIYIAPEDLEIKENTSVGKVTKLMSAYQSLEVDMARLENSVLGAETSQQSIAARVKIAKRAFCSRVNNVIDRLTPRSLAS